MPWIIMDDAFPDDPRVLVAGFEALGAVAACIGYCNRALSDGFLPTPAVARLGIRKPLLARLLAHDLLVQVPDGYELPPDVLAWQPTRERVERERKHKAARQARWRARVDASRDASQDAPVTPPVTPAHPAPPRPAPKGQGAGTTSPPRCQHGRRLAADGAGCDRCDQIPIPTKESA